VLVSVCVVVGIVVISRQSVACQELIHSLILFIQFRNLGMVCASPQNNVCHKLLVIGHFACCAGVPFNHGGLSIHS
jgi:hypothetical protein